MIESRNAGAKNLKFSDLHTYEPSKELQILTKHDFIRSESMSNKTLALLDDITGQLEAVNEYNYTSALIKHILFEDAAEIVEFEKNNKDLDNVTLEYIKPELYKFYAPKITDTHKSLSKNCKLLIKPMTSLYYSKHTEYNIFGFIDSIKSNHIEIRIGKRNNNILSDSSTTYHIHFLPNRTVYQFEKTAVDIIKRYNLSRYFFPQKLNIYPISHENYAFEWFNESIMNNPQQLQAALQIFYATSYPAPYLLFGPPGTGKTNTIVETICQLWKLKPTSHILVCTASNSACDEIASRLLKYIPKDSNFLFRIYASSVDISKVNKDLMPICNIKLNERYYPPLEEIYEKRIVLCTLCVAAKLVHANISSKHFSHIFIDECGSAKETTTLLAIAGLCTSVDKITGNIILSGDPKQLGPVVLSTKMVKLFQYDRSMIERLMCHNIYKRDPVSKKYDSNFLTKLIYNFRSHPAILKFSNEMFYDGELVAKASADRTNWCLGWEHLPSKQFPILFEFVNGKTENDNESTSLFNKLEIHYVMFYLKEILKKSINNRKIGQTDIGIISPYNSQCKKIRNECKKMKWNDIEIGSVDLYQGKEKPIIILSTVRSRTKSIGFLDNPKRLNVGFTRAQALLIVIGNPRTLQVDKYWHKFIEYCIENNAIRGIPFKLIPWKPVVVKLEEIAPVEAVVRTAVVRPAVVRPAVVRPVEAVVRTAVVRPAVVRPAVRPGVVRQSFLDTATSVAVVGILFALCWKWTR